MSATVSPVVTLAGEDLRLIREDGDAAALDCYRPFILEGFVSMVGNQTKVPVMILRDMAAFDSFILAGDLPLSDESDMGCSVPVGWWEQRPLSPWSWQLCPLLRWNQKGANVNFPRRSQHVP